MKLLLSLGMLLSLVLTIACANSSPTPSPDIPATVTAQVQEHLSSLPTATPYPTNTPYPTPAPHLQLASLPALTLEELVEVTFRCMQKNPSMKAGFVTGIVEEQPDSEELANLIADDFDVYQAMFLSGEDESEVREGLELMYSVCLTVAE